ncbi:pantetheine-phosphate adenylyltransferase [bacterium]|nr:pantetheine-phosphate adenylyltransferase [bacterium]
MAEKKQAIYPGSFDPITFGHIDIAKRALTLVDNLIIGVGINSEKKELFSADERKILISEVFKNNPKVSVISFDGLLIDFAREIGVFSVLRGLRAISDFEHELQLSSLNRHMDNRFDCFYMMTSEQYSYLSSSMVKEIARLNGDVSSLVPDNVYKALRDKYHHV